ncbi:MAG: hypothetical protein CMN25_10060 [Salinicola sp.]|uniref:hypothetical protein n=1 Tax=Salinicola sp. TaxID=1978524 RepID=UPI000C935162|nr:hypothetical protein [Salinicola sp.]MAM57666.1 hypothetical protein [Salinicola sp.]NRB54770.1 hypothetical protein [Salinicola sp.]|tara:strand:+ start:660 stop:884 length:225 start_codon:yes stop_codon:yes gene_type:complete
MSARRWIWGVWILVLSCYVVPYGLLGQVQAWYGSFLFWCVVGVLVIVANIMITRSFPSTASRADERAADDEVSR